jgi:hypothetical protein
VAFAVCPQRLNRPGMVDAAYLNLLVVTFSTSPVLASGLLAWQCQLEGHELKGIPLLHLVLACLSSVMIWLVWWIHYRGWRRATGPPSYRIPLEMLGVGPPIADRTPRRLSQGCKRIRLGASSPAGNGGANRNELIRFAGGRHEGPNAEVATQERSS